MNPKGVKLRESRDGVDHPQSLGIVFALDVTGSMGEIPKILATRELPIFMKTLLDCKIPEPQLLFMAVGDAVSDSAPLQVGQFESTAELMDQWLTWSYLEGGGGGTGQESYELAMYFLAMHTEMDSVVKRNKRGYLFMTVDEVPYPALSRHVVDSIIGDRLDEDLPCEEIVAELQKTGTEEKNMHEYMHIPISGSRITVAIEQIDDKTAACAIAYCSPRDQFCRRKGRKIASQRLNGSYNQFFVLLDPDKPLKWQVTNFIMKNIFDDTWLHVDGGAIRGVPSWVRENENCDDTWLRVVEKYKDKIEFEIGIGNKFGSISVSRDFLMSILQDPPDESLTYSELKGADNGNS